MNAVTQAHRQGYVADGDSLVPSRLVLQRYLICDRTLDRWIVNKTLGFPKPIVINKRRYWRVAELVGWERARAADRVPA